MVYKDLGASFNPYTQRFNFYNDIGGYISSEGLRKKSWRNGTGVSTPCIPSILEVEPVQPVQMNIYQSHTYRKNLSRLNVDVEPMGPSEGPSVLHICFCNLINMHK